MAVEANMKLKIWLLVLSMLSVAPSAFARFGYTNCQSADQNVVSSGYLDATSVLLVLKLKMTTPSLRLNFDMISEDGTQMIGINGSLTTPPTVPFHDGQKLVYQVGVATADLFDADGKLLAHLDCSFNPSRPLPGTFSSEDSE